MGILGALLALPVAATAMMIVEEQRVEMPGEQEQFAVEISTDRRKEEDHR